MIKEYFTHKKGRGEQMIYISKFQMERTCCSRTKTYKLVFG
jgi:hypothetical protein